LLPTILAWGSFLNYVNNYLHNLSKEERNIRIGNIVQYHPPCFIVTAGEEGPTYLKHYCIKEEISLLITSEPEVTSEFITKWKVV